MFEQFIGLSLIEIELTSTTLLHCITSNHSNTLIGIFSAAFDVNVKNAHGVAWANIQSLNYWLALSFGFERPHMPRLAGTSISKAAIPIGPPKTLFSLVEFQCNLIVGMRPSHATNIQLD